jgi:hypothetical protein
MAPVRQGRRILSEPKEVAPRKERKAFWAILLAAVVIGILALMIARHSAETQHEPVAVNQQNMQ